jgi:hypothetical protein
MSNRPSPTSPLITALADQLYKTGELPSAEDARTLALAVYELQDLVDHHRAHEVRLEEGAYADGVPPDTNASLGLEETWP